MDVQLAMARSIPALRQVEFMRIGYAIEYDYVPPDQIHAWLETKRIEGLFNAGQINGTTGYEEAAAQGLLAGINAALKATERAPVVLQRNQAYIGVLIDDLITREHHEPYRQMTSRAEYRLLLRQDKRRIAPGRHRLPGWAYIRRSNGPRSKLAPVSGCRACPVGGHRHSQR